MTPEDLAKLFHDTYERLAPDHGYQTRRASAVPWEDVPAANKSLMIAVAAEIIPAHAAMVREQVINDLDQLTIDGPAGWGLHCGDHTIIGAGGEMTAGQVVALALGHLASPQHTGRQP